MGQPLPAPDATDPRRAPDWVRLLEARATAHGARLAYRFLSSRGEVVDTLSFEALAARARAIASVLTAGGAAPGAPVLVVLPSGLDFIAAFFGCLYAGLIAVPVPPPRPHRPDHRMRKVAEDSGARVALTEARLVEQVQAVLPPGADVWTVDALPDAPEAAPRTPGPGAVAFLQYTSGSTSDPKGVAVTHGQLLANQAMLAEAFATGDPTSDGLTSKFRVVGWLPLHHDMGLIGNVLHPLYQGGECTLMAPETFLMRPLRWLEAIDRYRATTSGAPNFAYELCVERIPEAKRAGLDLSSWKVAFNGAEPVRAATLARFAAAFEPHGLPPRAMTPCYGLAEATLLVCAAEAVEVDPAGRVCCGRPPAGATVVVVDPETRRPRPDGEEGELWVHGPAVASGYHRAPDASAHTFGARLSDPDDARVFLRTGDLGYLDRGRVFVTGRLKDLMILGGQNYYPQDVEALTTQAHPGLTSGGAAAFAVDDPAGERAVVVAELHRRNTEDAAAARDAVISAVLEGLGLSLSEVVLIRQGTLPRTTSGKVRRSACREALLRGDLARLDGMTS
ncbi:MAG: fatty acyl-AMP ligase [Deltaproteobacteria bacterium]|nr:fatty acyl-AMP ligase [Deltaproteobacteria bacterium]